MELTNLPHKIYKQGNYVVIKPHNQPPKRRISSYTYIEEIDGNVRFAYGPDGIWLAPSNFLKADGTAWGATAEEAVANYLATNTVMENSSRANVPIPMAVRVVNFPDAGQNTGGISSNVSVLNFPESQPVTGHVSVDNLPQVQAVSGSVQVSNLPDVQPIEGTVTANVEFPEVQEVSGTVTAEVEFPAVQTVHVDNLPTTQKVEVTNPQTSVGVTGHVAVDNFPETQKVSVEGQSHVVVDNLPATQPVSGSVAVSNFPNKQEVTGTVGIQGGNTQAVKVDNSGVTQPISGAVSVSNIPAIQQIGGMVGVNNFPASQAVTGTVTANVQGGNGTAVKVDGTVNVGNLPTNQSVTVTNPVTIANPATSVSVSNFPTSQPVTGTFWPATQTISGSVSVSNLPSNQTVTVSNFPATQPVSGSVNATINGTVLVQVIPTEAKFQYFSNSISAFSGLTIAPAVAGKRNHLVGLQVAGLVALLSGDVQILDGTTVIYQFPLGAQASLSITFDQPLYTSVGNALIIRCAVTGLNMRIGAQGYTMAT